MQVDHSWDMSVTCERRATLRRILPGPLAVVWGLPTRLTRWVILPEQSAGKGDSADSFDGSEVRVNSHNNVTEQRY